MRTLSFLSLLALVLVAAPAQAVEVSFSIEAPGASSVYLAGEFNDWSDSAEPMTDEDGDGVFETTLDLAPGRYAYKFVVDGTWKEDPNASEFVDDGFGGQNSVVTVGEEGVEAPAGGAPGEAEGDEGTAETKGPAAEGERRVRFVIDAEGASSVHLAGEFNDWSDSARPMADEDGDGTFETILSLEPGRYAYKFVVDGTWKEDPNASEYVDDGYGGKNSIVEVTAGEGIQDAGAEGSTTGGGDQKEPVETGQAAPGGEATEGLRSVKFAYQPVISGVSEVSVAGAFNDWNVGATPMTDPDGDGTYEATLLLAPGTYPYKYVVDGTWITPDDADDFVDDGFGGKNGVLHVDARYATIDVEVGDGEFYLEGLDLTVDYGTVNEVTPGEVVFRARAYLDDVQGIDLLLREPGEDPRRISMELAHEDPVFANYRTTVRLGDPGAGCRFTFVWKDGGEERYALGEGGFAAERPEPSEWALYSYDVLPPFRVPEWAQQAVFYQIFPERFRNGNYDNDQTFEEPYYEGRTELPPSGKTNGEYFHFVDDWNDVAGLQRSPYRTDGKPDYYSFYGGDIEGVYEKLDYLASLGVSAIYFNPVTDARSNHRYDPCDYQKLDPHLASEELFREFTASAREKGIRVIVDMAYNHTGDCHFAFQDVIANWKQSEYFDWYEWKKRPPSYPLPPGEEAIDYYDCWWGFGLHPNLNFDLSRPQAQENSVTDIEEAEPNWDVVNHLLGSVDYWMGDLGVSGFRLDVPNEVPFWFWELFRERCEEVREDHLLVGEIWGDAGNWIGPDVFDAVMNYKYFKDPVVKWIAQQQGNAATFDRELAPGRSRYPLQAVRAQMNLVDSHDTARFLQIAGGDARRLRLAATFAMTYVGSPHIYYGDEVALTGGRDPDCRRTFPWDQIDVPVRAETLDHYQAVGELRRDHTVLSLGDFETVTAKGQVYSYVRRHEGETVLVALNNADTAQEVVLPVGNVGIADGSQVQVLLGEADLGSLRVQRGALKLSLPAVDGVILTVQGPAAGR